MSGPGPDDPAFWQGSTPSPKRPVSVHLKVDPAVLAFFKAGGKGHISRMQGVLRAYVTAMKAGQGG